MPYAPSAQNAARFGADKRSNAALEAVKNHRVILRRPEAVDIELEHAGKVTFDDADIPVVRALYDAEVADVDARLGGYLERMRETGLLERTIVIVSADHGEELFDHGWLGHASTGYDAKLYDELIRIPLIIRVPGAALRGRFDALVQGVDLMPTLFELLGIDAGSMEPQMQGHSMLPLVRGEMTSIRDFVFSQTTLKGWTTPRDEMRTRLVSVRSRNRKLIRVPTGEGTRIEAYHLDRDPGERNNIYAASRAEFRPLEAALNSWMRDNRVRAASLVLGGARRQVLNIANAVLSADGLERAVDSWRAIQTMESTWGLEPDWFYRTEPHASEWREVERGASRMIGLAMTCDANGGRLYTSKPSHPGIVDHWSCR